LWPEEVVVKIRKVIAEERSHNKDGVSVAGGVNAVIAANVNEPHSKTSVSSRRRIVQRSGKTVIDEKSEGGSDEQQ
jgi:hypothetical protein